MAAMGAADAQIYRAADKDGEVIFTQGHIHRGAPARGESRAFGPTPNLYRTHHAIVSRYASARGSGEREKEPATAVTL